MRQIDCDILIVGGGINGAGIARDAAGRGLKVVLCEKDDLAAHTSSASTKLIHGGLRYLGQFDFGLVRKSLIEREILLRSAPHIMHPLRFVMPHDRHQRPAWLIRAGLFLYDHLAPRELLPASHGIDLRQHPAGAALKADLTKGFVYSDGWVDDARLVVLNALAAAEQGAVILTQTKCVEVKRHADRWIAALQKTTADTLTVRARLLVNASGPWAAKFLHSTVHGRSGRALRLTKGSHIVVKKLFDHPYAYLFQHPDGRVVFAIPYENDFTLIGTTDLDYHGDPNQVHIDQQEIDYLCDLASRYFAKPVTQKDVVWSYSGVRPLVEDGSQQQDQSPSEVTRDYRLEWENDDGAAPLLSVFGGKLTTYRKLAEEALDLIAPALGNRHAAWTAKACLPGGDFYGAVPDKRAVSEFGACLRAAQQQYAWLPSVLVERYLRAYGTRIHVLLAQRSCLTDMGEEIAPGLFAAEVEYLMRHEWAAEPADILWRRTKLGLHLPSAATERLQQAMDRISAAMRLASVE
jgi:glycerol-3-phosphate dehydrogenase